MTEGRTVTLTPEQAEGLLNDGDTIHNFVQPAASLFVGCDFSREGAIEAFRAAAAIELGGPACQRMKHPIVVWSSDNRYSFFEADMAKAEAFEAALLAQMRTSDPTQQNNPAR